MLGMPLLLNLISCESNNPTLVNSDNDAKGADLGSKEDGINSEFDSKENSASSIDWSRIDSITDCEGHRYSIVKVGNQYWLGENLKCATYDTESENPGKVLVSKPWDPNDKESCNYADLVHNEIQSSESQIIARSMTNELKDLVGYHYNYAAAAGYDNLDEIELSDNEVRQGICPNGTHLPTELELTELIRYAGQGDLLLVASNLTSTEGWYNYGNYNNFDSIPHYDKYGMKVLPGGYSMISERSPIGLGSNASFYTSEGKTFQVAGEYDPSDQVEIINTYKTNFNNVRCICNFDGLGTHP